MNRQLTTLMAILVMAAVCLTATSAHAATILVDLSTAATVSNPAVDGKYWTSFGSGTNSTVTATDLIDSSNVPTTFDLSITTASVSAGGVSGAGFGGTGINGPAGADPFDEANAITDGLFVNNNNDGTALFEFSGLVANTDYDFSLIGGRASGGKDGGIKILAGTPDSNAVDLDVIESDDLLDSYNLLNDGTVLNFTVTSTASGEIDFRFFKGDGTDGNNGGSTFNAFSIDGPLIPEPASLALVGLGSLLIASRRRQRA